METYRSMCAEFVKGWCVIDNPDKISPFLYNSQGHKLYADTDSYVIVSPKTFKELLA